MWAGRNLSLERFRDSRPEGGVRPAAIVVVDVLPQDGPQMPFAERDYEIQALAAQGTDEPFAIRIRVGVRTGVFRPRRPKVTRA